MSVWSARWLGRVVGLGSLALLAACSMPPLPPIAPDQVELAEGVSLAGGMQIQSRAKRFGGISGMRWLSDDALLMLSDRGRLYRAHLLRDVAGNILAVDTQLLVDGDLLGGVDAEALEWVNGGWVISDEGGSRLVYLQAGSDRVPTGEGWLGPVQPLFTPQSVNRGVESLTLLPDGALLAIFEGEAVPHGGMHLMLIGADNAWQQAFYRASPPFEPTDAFTLADGRVLILERAASVLRGFQCRLTVVGAGQIRPGVTVAPTQLALFRAGPWTDNCEGLSARSLPDGRIEVLIVTDDNHLVWQRTLLIRLLLDAELAP